MPRAEQQVLIEAPVERVFEVISDYARYPEFLPDVKQTEVLSRHDGVVVVRFELELIMRVSYTNRFVEDPPYSLVWTLEDSKMMTLNNGGWKLAREGAHTRASYSLEVKLRGLIPKSVSTRLLGITLPETLQRFKTRAENQG